MQTKRYDIETARLEKATALPGFERTTLDIPKKKGLLIIGLLLLASAILIAFVISYKILFIIYTIYTIFIFMVYLVLWLDNSQYYGKSYKKIEKWPSVSIIIPSYNTIHTIFKCLESCKNLDYPGKLEIIVVDDGSTDGSYEKLKDDRSIILLRKQKNEGKAAALNFGIARTNCDIIGCVDSDSYPHKNTLINAIPYFEDGKKVGAVVLFIKTTSPTNLIQATQEIEYWLACGFLFKTIASIECLYLTPGPMSLYNKKMFEELGGFDEKNLTEDMEIALRMQRHKWRIHTCHSAVVETEVPATLTSFCKQRLRWARGGIMNIMKYLDMFFNPKYGTFGLFILPITLGSGFFAAFFMFWMLFNLFKTTIEGATLWFSNFYIMFITTMDINIDLFFIDSTLLIGAISFLIWAYFVYIGFEIANEKPSLKHVLPIFNMVYLYPIFVGLIFLFAYIYELSEKEYTW